MARCEKQIINKQYPLKVEVLDFFKNPSYRENFYCFNSLLIIIALLLCISVFTIKYMVIILAIISILAIIQPCLIGLKILTDFALKWYLVLIPLYLIVILSVILFFI